MGVTHISNQKGGWSTIFIAASLLSSILVGWHHSWWIYPMIGPVTPWGLGGQCFHILIRLSRKVIWGNKNQQKKKKKYKNFFFFRCFGVGWLFLMRWWMIRAFIVDSDPSRDQQTVQRQNSRKRITYYTISWVRARREMIGKKRLWSNICCFGNIFLCFFSRTIATGGRP